MSRILVVEDEPKSIRLLSMVLEDKGHSVSQATTVHRAKTLLATELFDLMITDVRLPDGSGIDLIESAHEDQPDLPVIVVTAYGNVTDAVRAMRLGAMEYMQKPFELEAMTVLVDKALAQVKIRAERDYLLDRLMEGETGGVLIVGHSQAMAAVRQLTSKVAQTRSNVLVSGESGTGKELVALAIHQASSRRLQPLIRVNCPAIPTQLFESELFGHIKGAFTGAFESRKGKFELAGEGTLFLDEVSEIPLDLQAKLLQVIEARCFTPVGGTTEVPMQARIVAATNRNLKKLVQEGKFRDDLYYRLNVFPIHIPPLRERREDIDDLVEHLLDHLQREFGMKNPGVTAEAMDALRRYRWPGNVRELRNVIERALVLAGREPITPLHLPEELCGLGQENEDTFQGRVEAYKKELLLETLRSTGWKKKQAATRLGLSQRALSHYVKRYDLDKNRPND